MAQDRKWTELKKYKEIKFDFFEGIAKITIDRPRYHNAFTPDTTKEMCDAILQCRENPDIRVVILTGTGDKAFCTPKYSLY